MFYEFQKGKVVEKNIQEIKIDPKIQYFGFIKEDESEAVIQKFALLQAPLINSLTGKLMVLEPHDSFDFISLNILNLKKIFSKKQRVYIYFQKNLLLFIYTFSSTENIFHEIMGENNIANSFERILLTFFERLVLDNEDYQDIIEQEIVNLENKLIISNKRDYIKEIISLRKRLLALKQYYEQLLNILDTLQENENNILSDNGLRKYAIFTNKVNRFYHNVLNLRDYVTQVREAYQAQLDISLNNTMKIFTTIAAIFLPLTLLVGWYGMNFSMPEYQWSFGYPIVIIIAIAIVIFCLVYFKRHKWF